MRRYLFPIVVEVIGIAIVAFGIGFEVASGADLGYILICAGSLTVAGGSLIWAKFMRRFK